ncbi:metal-dependent hydrolase [Vaginella massiliensis]|uniref:metal-dependent hydrolase n=1 Tax=Vaginella massiliensis TaxID=1816680 RepID=UPI0008397F94|nr:metal-dependent hydrolase [Vaginella massiliensis]
MKVTYLGHASLLIEIEGKRIIVDPFITPNELAKNIDFKQLQPDYILLTHAHQDHVYDVEELAKQKNASIISNAEIASYYAAKGFETHGMNTGGKYTFDFGALKSTIAFHSSSFADGSYGGNPNGYIIENKTKRLYIAGDTALTYEMKLIPETIGKLDLGILPIGDNFTMGVDDAVIAAEYLQLDRVLGYHYNTFPPIKIDVEQAKSTFADAGKTLIILPIGEALEI